ncbi:hypothetical protein, partial [uncultured Rhodoblastus sp.]|uniref:hypothetical protein n=1 Tax=uncultured Rhodoblastus sp. TaxID=543037 RepID=UPI0025E0FF23
IATPVDRPTQRGFAIADGRGIRKQASIRRKYTKLRDSRKADDARRASFDPLATFADRRIIV